LGQKIRQIFFCQFAISALEGVIGLLEKFLFGHELENPKGLEDL
jgi:hypothetical protein